MEGKACLFQKFAGIDVFDIELAERNPDKLVDIIAALEPTLGGVNLEDIKAPECFYIEKKLRERMKIPVFHDDQHGTAIISSAALLNGLELVGKNIADVKVAVSGAGAAAIACLDLMVELGVKRDNVYVCDSKGVIHGGRTDNLDDTKQRYSQTTHARTLGDVMVGADVLLGCSAGGAVTPEMLKTMARQPIILALANPEPEIRPELAKEVRPDCIIATGRSDYPNQVNNVLCFPYIFRGALDCGATSITEAMKAACVREIADLAKEEISAEVASAYPGRELRFGSDYLIPTPFDSRLILRIAPAVAAAAEASGVATRPIKDMALYRQSLMRFVTPMWMLMRPVFDDARLMPKRVVYADGEDERVLRAVQIALGENILRPILIGRPAVIASRIEKSGLRLQVGRDFEVFNLDDDVRLLHYSDVYHRLKVHDGVTSESAKAALRQSQTIVAALMVHLGDADGMLCGLVGDFDGHLAHVKEIIGLRSDTQVCAAINALMLPKHPIFIADTHINNDPSAEQLANISTLAVEVIRRFGLSPRLAFLSHSSFGNSKQFSALKMRVACDLFVTRMPNVPADGEMYGDLAFDEALREIVLPGSTLTEPVNLLVMPGLDAANILFNVLKMSNSQGSTVGPILIGMKSPAHILTTSATVQRIVNMTALTVAQAGVSADGPCD